MNLALRILSSLTVSRTTNDLALCLGARVETVRNIISILKALGLVRGKGRYVITDLGKIVLERAVGKEDINELKRIIERVRESEGYISDKKELEEEKNRDLLEVVVIE